MEFGSSVRKITKLYEHWMLIMFQQLLTVEEIDALPVFIMSFHQFNMTLLQPQSR
ncbi:hypothetical protein CASFOL_012529 [Castilleja foliolosa]|uniref:Uncharacterized protein n=1 Tax=Castilleja foliolosa TaxID=1961234 RepID=A0ABD3DIN6_9LAMI